MMLVSFKVLVSVGSHESFTLLKKKEIDLDKDLWIKKKKGMLWRITKIKDGFKSCDNQL